MRLTVNGTVQRVEALPDATLLEVLRDGIGLKGTKEACGRGECGACTVLIGANPVVSCLVLAGRVDGPVTTIEGLADEILDLREAFADLGGFQCGFCTSGQLVHAAALLREGLPADPTQAERVIRLRLSGNICRCTGYTGIVDAVMRTAVRRGMVSGGD
jgi:carbon-monoxide dehydrogenase small subunit/xanthine dehydrogenase YagT iron-sulfur-binding subunit